MHVCTYICRSLVPQKLQSNTANKKKETLVMTDCALEESEFTFSLLKPTQDSESTTRNLRISLFEPPDRPIVMTTEEFQWKFRAIDDWWRLSAGERNGRIYYKCRLGMRWEESLKKRQTEETRAIAIPRSKIDKQAAAAKLLSFKNINRSVCVGIQCDAKIVVVHNDDGTYTVSKGRNSTQHTHPIDDPRNRAIPSLGANKVFDLVNERRYIGAATVARSLGKALQEDTTPKKNKELKIEHIGTKKVANIQQKLDILPDKNLSKICETDDLDMCSKFLREINYWVMQYGAIVDGKAQSMICFASNDALEIMSENHFLVMMDSTHCTNKRNWKLSTIYSQSPQGVWIPGCQAFVSNETIHLLSKMIFLLRTEMQRRYNVYFEPRYWIIDQSNTERSAIKEAFTIENWRILYCAVHLFRTIMRKTSSHKLTFQLMMRSICAKTKVECLQLYSEAIRVAPPTIKTYLLKHWKTTEEDDFQSWALCFRQATPALLQNNFTNALESYHSMIKKESTRSKVLTVALKNITTVNSIRFGEVEKEKALDGARYNSDLSGYYPGFEKIGIHLQNEVFKECREALNRICKGKIVRTDSDPLACSCDFTTHFLLPCRHLFQRDMQSDEKILTRSVISDFTFPLLSKGLQYYQKEKTPAQNKRTDQRDTRAYNMVTELRAMHENHVEHLYALAKMNYPPEVYQDYLKTYQKITQEFIDAQSITYPIS